MFQWLRRKRPDGREIDEEIRHHLTMLAKERIEEGESVDDAESFARRKLGNSGWIREETQAMWGNKNVHQIGRDMRFAARMMRKSPGFYTLVVTIMALGMAASVSFFSLVDGVLLRPLPYRDPGRLVTLTSYAPKPPYDSNGSLSYNDFRQLKARASSFAGLAVTYRTGWSRVTLTGDPDPVPMQGSFVSPNLFSLFGRSPLLGRTFTAEENQRGERLVVISEGLWQRQFGSSPNAIGRALRFGGVSWKVIGVMPYDFQVPFLHTQLWAPLRSRPDDNPYREADFFDQPYWDVMGRLKDGIPLAASQAEIDSIAKGLRMPQGGPDIRVVPLREHLSGAVEKPLILLFGAVAALLLIALANVANLLLARASQRERELAIRAALGAGRGQLLRQLLTEVSVLVLASGLLGIAGAYALLPLLIRLAPGNTPLLDYVELNRRVLAFAFLVSVLSGLLLGLITAWRLGKSDAGDSLKAAGRNATGTRKSVRLKAALVVAEFAIAMVLLTGAGLLIRSFTGVLEVDPGFRAVNILTVHAGLPNGNTPERTRRFYGDAFARISSLPGVEFAGAISNLFFLDEQRTHALRQVEGRPPEPAAAWTPLVWTQIAGDYFRAMGIPLLEGRFFNAADGPTAPPVAIVNETLARRYWPNEDAVGKRLKGFDPRGQHDDWVTVVGVVRDTHSGGMEKSPFSQIYEVQAQRGDQTGNFVVRTTSNPSALAGSVRPLIHGLDPNASVTSISTMEQLLESQRASRRFQTWLVSVFSGLALLLAALGIFAIMHYSVAARTNEIGIRMALGADVLSITRLVLGQGSRLAAGGILAGAAGSLWVGNEISGMLYRVGPTDPVSFGGAALTLFGVALLACYLPARRAAGVHPLSALRDE